MTKADLIEALQGFDDNAEIEICLPYEACRTLEEYRDSEKYWVELHGVELLPVKVDGGTSHCLLYAFKTVMA